jgi:hypothetical protein
VTDPDDEELAAIVAAIEASWPRAVVAAPAPPTQTSWRFAGRWWTKPIPVRRDRPW